VIHHELKDVSSNHVLISMTGVSMRKDIAHLTALMLCCGAASAYAGDANMGRPLSNLIQPGFYGRVDIGNAAPPPVVYAQPILIFRPAKHDEPIYLHVPPAHAKDWGKHCRQYHSCKEPVFFVRSGEFVRDTHYSAQAHEHDYDNYRYDSQQSNK